MCITNRLPIVLLVFLVFGGLAETGNAQTGVTSHRQLDAGIPDILNLDLASIGYDPNIWSVTRDSRGILFVANPDGLLEWDFTEWRLHRFPGRFVFSMALAPSGEIFLGALNAIGRTFLDGVGKIGIEVLSDHLPDSLKPVKQVNSIRVIGKHVWFRSDSMLHVWDGSTLRLAASKRRFGALHEVDGRVFVLVDNSLQEIRNGRLVVVPGATLRNRQGKGDSEGKPEGESIHCMLSMNDGRILLHSHWEGWLWYDGKSLVPAWTARQRSWLPHDVSCGLRLADGTFAIGTTSSGIWIIHGDGTVLKRIDRPSGLRDEKIMSLYQDHEYNLWAALDNGLARIAWPAVSTKFSRLSNLNGRISALTRFRGSLFVGSTQGLFRLIPTDVNSDDPFTRQRRFEVIDGVSGTVFGLLDCGSELLVANTRGLYSYDGKKPVLISNISARVLHPVSKRHDSILVTHDHRGVSLLLRRGGGWTLKPILPELGSVTILDIIQTADSRLWIGTSEDGVYSIPLHAGITSARPRQLRISESDPQPPLRLFPLRGRLHIVTDEANYLIDEKSETIILDTTSWKDLGIPQTWGVASMGELPDGRNWFDVGTIDRRFHAAISPNPDGSHDVEELRFLGRQVIHSLYVEKDGVCWFGGQDFLARYESALDLPMPTPPRTLIRAVYKNDTTVFYWGNQPAERADIVVPFSITGVKFLFFAPALRHPELTEYRWRLTGEQNEWSEWSTKPTAEFPGLSEGSYTFEVQARLGYDRPCEAALIRVRVTPPWERSWWAYGLYLIGGIGVFVLTLRLRTRTLEQRSRELEQTVRERTVEIRQQSEKIRSQAEELETLDSIVRTVNKEVRLTDVLSALLQQTLLLFPSVNTAFYLQRSSEDGLFRLVATVGEPVERFESHAFTLSELMNDSSNSLQTIQDGVYVLSGLDNFWNRRQEALTGRSKTFMGMSDMQLGGLRGFLVLGSDMTHSFNADDLRRLLRLREHVSSAVAKALAIRELETKNELLDLSNKQLREMQQQLIVHEKLAALGELTAGIAHEIQNPLNFVNNFSSLSLELLDELEQDLTVFTDEEHASLRNLISTVRGNCERIREHGMRATSIVRAMLMHTRKGSGRRETVSLNEFLDQFVLLSYHGMRMLHPEFDLRLHTEYDRGITAVRILPQEMSRVIVNICNNAWEAAIDKAQKQDGETQPQVQVRSVDKGDRVRITVRDNGAGIPLEMHGRIFEPFFTTKRSGNNAGLGLSMSYEIVTQLHQGRLTVESDPGAFSEFVIDIPKSEEAAAVE